MPSCPIKKPHLPGAPVTLCAIAQGVPELEAALHRLGIATVVITAHPSLPVPVAAHPDMQLLHLGAGELLIAQGAGAWQDTLREQAFTLQPCIRPLGARYPTDCLLNACLAGDSMIGRCRSLDPQILHYCEKNNIKAYDVRQGYANCSTCVIGEQAIITADPSISAAGRKAGMDVLEITPGWIELPGYNYGFLGGCCGKLDRDLLAFTGAIEQHPDYAAIRSFCGNYGIRLVSLLSGMLRDVGGIIPLMQKNPASQA